MEIAGCGFISVDLNEVGNYLVQQDYCELFPTMWSALEGYVAKDKWKERGCENLQNMLYGFMGVADRCAVFVDELVKVGVISTLVPVLYKLDHKDSKAYDLINPILGVLQNSIRINNSHRHIYRQEKAVPVLEGFMDTSNMELKTDSLLILAYIVEEEDNKHLGDKGVVGFLVNLLKSAINTKKHVAYLMSGAYSALELLDGLNHLAVNDENKLAIDKEAGIPVIVRMLQKEFTVEEQKLAAEGLWNLAFIESIRQNMLKRGVVQGKEVLMLCLPILSVKNVDIMHNCIHNGS